MPLFHADPSVLHVLQTGRKLFTRSSAYHELITDRDSSYCDLMVQASLVFDEQKGEDSKELALFKVNGAQIGSGRICFAGNMWPWTLGNYLQFVAKRAPSQLKIGWAMWHRPAWANRAVYVMVISSYYCNILQYSYDAHCMFYNAIPHHSCRVRIMRIVPCLPWILGSKLQSLVCDWLMWYLSFMTHINL